MADGGVTMRTEIHDRPPAVESQFSTARAGVPHKGEVVERNHRRFSQLGPAENPTSALRQLPVLRFRRQRHVGSTVVAAKDAPGKISCLSGCFLGSCQYLFAATTTTSAE